ncbi:MAG: peptidylprolyl isomerase [Pseudomonadota bacterium]|nr:peptidylprolyl isomerase [Pseudomonadota bacterium]
MKKLLFLALLFLAPVLTSGLHAQQPARNPDELYAVIDTSRGSMEFVLYPQVAPLTVANFVNLAARGYYDGLSFHRVVPNFMAQGGDPKGDGSGGPGYEFEDEIAMRMNQEGILAMANAGPATNGSQFFITHLATPHLNGGHTVFGLVQSGREVIRQLRIGDTINSITIIGDAAGALERRRARVMEWNAILDRDFPNLKPSLLQ